MDCPPPEPPPIVLPADPVTVDVPARTLRWLADRDVYGERAYACIVHEQGRLQICKAGLNECAMDAANLAAELHVVSARGEEWQHIARRRPSWGLTAGLMVGALAVGVVGWEALR